MFQTGNKIGSYTLIEKLGRGAFGEVWLAEEKTAISTHKVALKLPNEADVDLDAIRQEAVVWEQVKGHPNILPIIKADIVDDQIYIAGEYAPGGSLNEWLKEHGGKAPSVDVAVEMTRGILSGLEHLHSKGVIHRDLKPSNILLQAETPRIADFGIARLAKAGATENSALSAGTPSYMAPEGFQSVRSEQTDVWAVGVLFHKILSGKLPFSHPDQVSVMNAIINSEPEIDSSIPEELQAVIRKALQKNPALRYKTAAEMQSDLFNYQSANISSERIPVVTPPKPVIKAAPAPVFDREEETVVRKKPKKRIYVRPFRREDDSPNYLKTVAVALTTLLVVGAIAVWAAIQLSGNSAQKRSDTIELSDQSNRNSLENRGNNLTPLNQPDAYSNPPMNPSAQIPAATGGVISQEIPAPTPYSVQTDTPASNVNIQSQTVQIPESEATPITIDTPIAPPKKTSTPILLEPEATPPSTVLRQRVTRPTPKPTAATPQVEETPPPMPKSDNPGAN